jgi:glycerol-3-phosphate acyltransferase PlsY
MLWPLLILAAFLSGSIPFGLLIGRAKGIDIRQHGSKNIGATNVGRVLGKKAGFLCFALDVAKGVIPVLVAGGAAGLLNRSLAASPIAPKDAWLWLAIMAASILGHMFSPWVGFKGGKGVATGLGAALGIFPYLTIPGLAAFAIWIITVKLSRYVSLASILAAAALPFLVVAWAAISTRLSPQAAAPASLYPFYTVAALLGALIVYRHRGNITRLFAGTENRIGARKPSAP